MAEEHADAQGHFAFGKNWTSFVTSYLNPDRIEEAKKSLREFTGLSSFEGKSFVDVGCGSGLFCLAAHQLGASKILGFDVDRNSARCCERLKSETPDSGDWSVREGSILDDAFVASLPRFDIVYSWGVLHHTGSMWKAIEKAACLVTDNGLLYIAIYNKADGLALYPDMRVGPSGFWAVEKRLYSKLPSFLQNCIDYTLMSILVVGYLLTLQNPVKKIRGHKALRGMSWRIDIKDWLGGYPYEYASVAEVFRFMKDRGFALENLKCNNGLLNNEYLFRRRGSPGRAD